MRDNTWLENKMWEMLHNNFADVPITNDLIIKFGRRAKRRLGSIRRRECVGNSHGNSLLGSFVLKSSVAKFFGFRGLFPTTPTPTESLLPSVVLRPCPTEVVQARQAQDDNSLSLEGSPLKGRKD